MGYIIVWRHGLKEPHIGLSDHDFAEVYSTFEKAKEDAEIMRDPNDKWYCDYAIYQEVNS